MGGISDSLDRYLNGQAEDQDIVANTPESDLPDLLHHIIEKKLHDEATIPSSMMATRTVSRIKLDNLRTLVLGKIGYLSSSESQEAFKGITKEEMDQVILLGQKFIKKDFHDSDKALLVHTLAKIPKDQREDVIYHAKPLLDKGITQASSIAGVLEYVRLLPQSQRKGVVDLILPLLVGCNREEDITNVLVAVGEIPEDRRENVLKRVNNLIFSADDTKFNVKFNVWNLRVITKLPSDQGEATVVRTREFLKNIPARYDKEWILETLGKVPSDQIDELLQITSQIHQGKTLGRRVGALVEDIAAIAPKQRREFMLEMAPFIQTYTDFVQVHGFLKMIATFAKEQKVTEISEIIKAPKIMQEAVQNGEWKAVAFLLSKGASFKPADFPNQKDVYLHAINENLPELVPLLKAQGWDINGAQADGLLPIVSALNSPNWKSLVPAFAKAGADINKLDWQGIAPIHYATYHLPSDALQLLLQLGASPSRLTHQGETALHFALAVNSKEKWDLLVKSGADLQQVGRLGVTPLEYALGNRFPVVLDVISDFLLVDVALLDLKDYYAGKIDFDQMRSNIQQRAQGHTTDGPLAVFLILAFLLNDKSLMGNVARRISPDSFEIMCGNLEKQFPGTSFDSLKYCMWEIVPEHFKAGAKQKETEVVEPEIDPNSITVKFQALDAVKNKQFPSGIDRVAPADLHEANKAYFSLLNPLQILFKSQRLLSHISDAEKIASFLQKINEAKDAEALHKVYMDIMLYHVENEFSKINFTKTDQPGYRDPAKITFMGEKKTKEELLKNLTGMVTYTKFRTPYTGTPPEKTKELEKFYKKLETKLDEYLQELFTCTDSEQRATVQLDLAKEVGQCAAKWLQYVSQSTDTLRGKVKVLGFEDKFHQALQDYHSGIIQEMVTEGNVHEYNHFVSQVGQDLNLPDADTFEGYHDMFEDQFRTKDQIRELFDVLNSPGRNVAFAKGFLDEQLKNENDRDLLIDWFTARMPADWPDTPADYLFQEVFDEKNKIRPTAAVRFLSSLEHSVLADRDTIERAQLWHEYKALQEEIQRSPDKERILAEKAYEAAAGISEKSTITELKNAVENLRIALNKYILTLDDLDKLISDM